MIAIRPGSVILDLRYASEAAAKKGERQLLGSNIEGRNVLSVSRPQSVGVGPLSIPIPHTPQKPVQITPAVQVLGNNPLTQDGVFVMLPKTAVKSGGKLTFSVYIHSNRYATSTWNVILSVKDFLTFVKEDDVVHNTWYNRPIVARNQNRITIHSLGFANNVLDIDMIGTSIHLADVSARVSTSARTGVYTDAVTIEDVQMVNPGSNLFVKGTRSSKVSGEVTIA